MLNSVKLNLTYQPEERLKPSELPCVNCGERSQERIVAVTFTVENEDKHIPPVLTYGYRCCSCESEFLSPQQEEEIAEDLGLEAYEIIHTET